MESGPLQRHLFYPLLFFLVLSFLFPPVSFCSSVTARAAVVMDAASGRILFSKNPDLPHAPASTTKLMTAILTLEQADLSASVAISKNASRVPRYRMGLKAGEKATIEFLLYAALLKSSNDAAVALAEGVAGSEESFVRRMNEKALSIGARSTRFTNPHGLPDLNQFTTASDLAKIMAYALGYPKLTEIIGTPSAEFLTEKGKVYSLKNTDKLLGSDDGLVGGKTGFTNTAGHCFVCAAKRDDKTIIVSVLGSPSRKTLWKETQALITKGFQALTAQPVSQ
jgi:serine-type D-Ala-D-Ala carboxypeptidase (penicillin-binding protein 5/6)